MTAERKVEDPYPRAPRYIIDISDHQVVRFAQMPKGSKAMHTRIINLSESGMAFLVPYLTSPELEEVIKVEFSAPNTDSIACFAKVVRVQIHRTYNKSHEPQSFKLVAVEFKDLHPKQRHRLASGLTEQFRKKQKDFEREQLFYKFKYWALYPLNWIARSLLNKKKPSQNPNNKNQIEKIVK